MKVIKTSIRYLIGLLSIIAGAAKVLQTQQEMDFLHGIGLGTTFIVLFGVAQVGGGVLLVPARTRFYGGNLVTAMFVASGAILAHSANLMYALYFLVLVALSGLVTYQSRKPTHQPVSGSKQPE